LVVAGELIGLRPTGAKEIASYATGWGIGVSVAYFVGCVAYHHL